MSGSTVSKVALVLVGAFALFIFSVTVFIPRAYGGHALAVRTGSMEPAIAVGDLVITEGTDSPQDIHEGDVIAFLPHSEDPTLIIHRVVSVDTKSNTFVTRGDSNNVDDPPIVFEQIRGKEKFTVPGIGHLVLGAQSLASPNNLPKLPMLAGAVLIIAGLALFGKNMTRTDNKKTADTDVKAVEETKHENYV